MLPEPGGRLAGVAGAAGTGVHRHDGLGPGHHLRLRRRGSGRGSGQGAGGEGHGRGNGHGQHDPRSATCHAASRSLRTYARSLRDRDVGVASAAVTHGAAGEERNKARRTRKVVRPKRLSGSARGPEGRRHCGCRAAKSATCSSSTRPTGPDAERLHGELLAMLRRSAARTTTDHHGQTVEEDTTGRPGAVAVPAAGHADRPADLPGERRAGDGHRGAGGRPRSARRRVFGALAGRPPGVGRSGHARRRPRGGVAAPSRRARARPGAQPAGVRRAVG